MTPIGPKKFDATAISVKDFSTTINVQFDGDWTVANTDSTSNLVIESNGNNINISSPNGEDIAGRVITIVDSTGEAHSITL